MVFSTLGMVVTEEDWIMNKFKKEKTTGFPLAAIGPQIQKSLYFRKRTVEKLKIYGSLIQLLKKDQR